MANTTLGSVINAGLVDIGEPEIASFTSTNLLELSLIEAADNARVEINNTQEYSWALKRATLATVDDYTTGTVSVTNASATITGSGTTFTSAMAGRYIRVGTDLTSYKISAFVSVTEVTLETAYVGSTASGKSYVILKDEYTTGVTDLGELKVMSYGDSGSSVAVLSGYYDGQPMTRFNSVDDLVRISGGDLHRNSSGKPEAYCEINMGSESTPVLKLWPYPKSVYLMELWYKSKFTALSAFADNLWGSDAPEIANLAVEYAVKEQANLWDENYQKAQYWAQKKTQAVMMLRSREARGDHGRQTMAVETNRRQYHRGIEVRSQHYFDTKPAWKTGWR